MDESSFPQLSLFELTDTFTSTAELFPEVWKAVEGLAAPEAAERRESLDRLVALGAPRISPLVAYVLVTRLIDPDLPFRVEVIRVLGEMLSARDERRPVSAVRRYLRAQCMVIGKGTVLAILEALLAEPVVLPQAAAIFRLCSHSGNILVDLALNRKLNVRLREQAIIMLGEIGFVQALEPLERLMERLTERSQEQRRMPFAPPAYQDEAALLPGLRKTLNRLYLP